MLPVFIKAQSNVCQNRLHIPDRKHIRQLIVITNDVHADVERNRYTILERELKGTVICWEHHGNAAAEGETKELSM